MIILMLALLGLCFGSFINALVWRLHEQQSAKTKKAKRELSMVHGRSMCVHCHHILAPKDLIPVFSWLSLRGKCRYCHKSIGDNPAVEAFLPLVFIASYLWWPYGFGREGVVLFILWLIFLVGFVAMAIYDLRWYLLPNKLMYPLFILAGIQLLLMASIFGGGLDVFRQALWGLLIGGGIFYLLFQVSKGKWIGGGDVKLGGLLGIIVGGPGNSLLVLFIASLLGTLVAVPLLATGKATRGTRLPFGPFLIAAGIIVYLFGASIIHWYRTRLLLY